MMKKQLTILLIFIVQCGWSQEFIFDLFIADNQGNIDSIEIGYDINASDSMDIGLGETNIFDKSWKKPLEVRCTNVWEDGNFPSHEEIHLKRWVSKLDCNDQKKRMLVKLDILTNNWPITITWDSTKLQNECLNYSVITDRWVANWFDIASANNIDLCMGGTGKGKFDRHESLDKDHIRVEPQSGDTIFFVYVGLGNEWITNSTTSPPPYCILTTSIKENKTDRIEIRNNCIIVNSTTTDDISYRLYSTNGQLIESGRVVGYQECLSDFRGIRILEVLVGDLRIYRKIYMN